MGFWTWFWIIVLVLVALAVWRNLHDIKRYLRIRSM